MGGEAKFYFSFRTEVRHQACVTVCVLDPVGFCFTYVLGLIKLKPTPKRVFGVLQYFKFVIVEIFDFLGFLSLYLKTRLRKQLFKMSVKNSF